MESRLSSVALASSQRVALLTTILCGALMSSHAGAQDAQPHLQPPAGAQAHPGGAVHASTVPPKEALQRLQEGNLRFVTGKSIHPNQSAARREELSRGQHPFAVILTCADSRVAPELYFDQGLGDLFVIRNAGNILDDHVAGSIEYAVEHLRVPLIVVVGHSQCGAVSAAVAGGETPGHIRSIVEAIAPAAQEVKAEKGDQVDNTVRAHARRVAAVLARTAPLLQPAAKEGRLMILPARYDLRTGKVELLPEP